MMSKPTPVGVKEISRGLSAAIPPVVNKRVISTLEGSQKSRAVTPPGSIPIITQSRGYRCAKPPANLCDPFRVNQPGRRGFTLLEMILALAIGIVLMYSLYSVLNIQVHQAQGGRLTLQEATLARSILTRMAGDILGNLGPVNTFVQPDPNAAPASGTADTGATDATTSSTPSGEVPATIALNTGVYGTSNVLVLTVSKVPRELNLTGAMASDNAAQQALVCDLRRISYWMMSGGPDKNGLARQELLQVTGSDLGNIPPDVPDAASFIIAPEVRDIAFQFWDGTSWQDSWDGTTLGGPLADTPIGPPSAIKITITFSRKDADGAELTDDQLPRYSQVIAIPAGNNFPQTSP